MTERAENLEYVCPVAFGSALILAPLAVALMSLLLGPLALYAVGAIIAGGPVYLLIGGPFLWWGLRRGLSGPFVTALIGVIANVAALPLVMLAAIVAGETRELWSLVAIYLTMGTFFATFWGGAFGLLYRIFSGAGPADYSQRPRA